MSKILVFILEITLNFTYKNSKNPQILKNPIYFSSIFNLTSLEMKKITKL